MGSARRVLGTLLATATGTGALVAAAVLCRGAVRDLSRGLVAHGWAGLPFDTVLGGLAALVLAAGAAWLGLGVVLTAVDLVAGLCHAAATRVTPAVVRRVVALGCGAALGSSAALAAHAAEAPGAAGPVRAGVGTTPVAHVLSGLALPDRAVGTAARTAPSVARVHTVRPGESLWSVTATALGPRATAADVAAGWRRLHAVNRDRVGDDPDLLLPGTTLRLPPAWTAAAAHPDTHREDPS